MMKNLKMIACVSRDGGLGRNGELLWHIPEDMQFFKQMTLESTVVMGGKTFASIGRALPGRRNIVLTRRDLPAKDVEVAHSEAELRKLVQQSKQPVFVIGGASLYQMFIEKAEEIYLTEVDDIRPADTFFPRFDKSQYQMEVLQAGMADGIKYQMVRYCRKD